MKNYSAWPALLFMLLPLASAGQSIYKIQYDSLTYFQEITDTAGFYKCLSRQAKIAAEKLKDKTQLDNLSRYLVPVPHRVSKTYYPFIRKTSSIFASKYLRSFGDYQKAESYYLLAHRYAMDSILLDNQVWYVENELINIYNRWNAYEKAGYYFNLTINSLKYLIKHHPDATLYKEQYARLFVNIGRLDESEGQQEEAMAAYRNGVSLAKAIGSEKGLQGNATALAHLAIEMDSLALADEFIQMSHLAMDSLQKENDYKERHANISQAEAKYCVKLAMADTLQTNASRCLEMYMQAIDTLIAFQGRRPSREVAKYLVEYADALLTLDSVDAAGRTLSTALQNILAWSQAGEEMPSKDLLYKENTFIQVFQTYARLFKRRYQQTSDSHFLSTSILALDNAIYVNDLILNQVAADPSKLAAIHTNKRLVHEQLNDVYLLYTLSHDDAYLSRARALFNRSKSLLLDEKIRHQQSIADLTDEEKTYLRTWQYELKTAHESKLEKRFDSDSLSRVIYHLQQKIDGVLESPLHVKPVKPVAGDYIEYAVYEKEIFVLAAISDSVSFIRWAEDRDIHSLLERLNSFIEQRGLSEDSTIQHDLYKALIPPLAMKMPEKITILPDGEISYIPFDLLVNDKGQMLIENTTIRYAYQYQSPDKEDRKIQPPYEVCCLAPSYRGDWPEEELATRGSLHPLPYAGWEVDSIQRLYGDRALKLKANHDLQLLDSLPMARIFHFSGHAIVNKHEAYLALGSKEDPTSKLTVDELSQMASGPELVVLSACETGLGKLETGEGVRSLGRSFAEAGAETIVFSLWNVLDASTSQLMILFHQHIKAGQSVDEALRNAKLAYISMSEENMRHPYFWAGFVVIVKSGR